MVYINNLKPRNDILIDNNYELVNNSNDDFHIVVYYLNENKCKIIVRRLDNFSGWGVNLKIKLYKLDKNIDFATVFPELSEYISIGNSEKNEKIINIYTKIKLYKKEESLQKIPKLIIQTTSTKNIENIDHYNSILTFIELNPEYEYKIFDDNECREFIKKNFDEITLLAYDLLIPGAFKADFFRYCILYIHGGCYFDCKQILRTSLNKIINEYDEFILCKDLDIGYFNAVIMSIKNNNHLLKTIEECKKKIFSFNNYFNIYDKNFNHLNNILNLTGPKLIYYAIHNDMNENKIVKLYHVIENFYHSYQNYCIKYNNKIIITKNYNTHIIINPQHYSVLWEKYEILYKNNKIINNYKFFIYAHLNTDIFNFYIINNESFIIIRTDNNSGWGHNYKLKIINEATNEIFYIEIGSSDKNYKIINFKFNNINISNKNIIMSYKNYDENYNLSDKFNLFLVNENKINKLIIIRTDLVSGWDHNLKMIININNKNYNIDVGSSEKVIKIINIDLK